MPRRRQYRRARENPLKTRDKVLIGVGGAVALGLGIFFVTRPAKAEDKKDSGNGKTDNGKPQNGGDAAEEKAAADQAASDAAFAAAAAAKTMTAAPWATAYREPYEAPAKGRCWDVVKGDFVDC